MLSLIRQRLLAHSPYCRTQESVVGKKKTNNTLIQNICLKRKEDLKKTKAEMPQINLEAMSWQASMWKQQNIYYRWIQNTSTAWWLKSLLPKHRTVVLGYVSHWLCIIQMRTRKLCCTRKQRYLVLTSQEDHKLFEFVALFLEMQLQNQLKPQYHKEIWILLLWRLGVGSNLFYNRKEKGKTHASIRRMSSMYTPQIEHWNHRIT